MKFVVNNTELGSNINVLKIKELIIEENEKAIISRTELAKSDNSEIDETIKKKLENNIKELKESIEILKNSNVKYKFNGLFVHGRKGLIEAKFQPKFISDWKLHMDSVSIPPTIFKAIDDLKIKRPYNHIKFNNIMDETNEVGAALVEFKSIRYNALKQKQIKSFIISCSFVETSDFDSEDSEVSLEMMEV